MRYDPALDEALNRISTFTHHATRNTHHELRITSCASRIMDERSLIQDKLREYLAMAAPLGRAEAEVALARRMLRARTEDELHHIAPALGVLSESLEVSTLDLLLADDHIGFIHGALERSGMSLHEL